MSVVKSNLPTLKGNEEEPCPSSNAEFSKPSCK